MSKQQHIIYLNLKKGTQSQILVLMDKVHLF